jgi:hypothetical protein
MLKGCIRSDRVALSLVALLIALAGTIGAAGADDAKALSARLSDQAFALMNSISAKGGTPSPLLGPIGVFAADSQKLSSAIQSSDRQAAGAAMASLKSDATDVEKAGAKGGLDTAKWGAITHDLDALSTMIPALPAPAAAAASAESAPPPSASGTGETPPGGEVTSSSGSGDLSRPVVKIESADLVSSDVLRIKGYMSGHAIRSAGIYFEGSRLANLDVKRVPGDQTIRFNLQIRDPVQGSVLRVYDSAGHIAQASILGPAQTRPIVERGTPNAPAEPSLGSEGEGNVAVGGGDDFDAEMKAVEKNAGEPGGVVTEGSGSVGAGAGAVEASTGGLGAGSSLTPGSLTKEGSDMGANTEEIPPASPPLSGPKSRMDSQFTAHGPSDLQIQIQNLSVVDPGMHEYLVRGQISGSHLKRAGIYVGGRLAQSIPLNHGTGSHVTNFAQSFTDVGSEATIRVYRTRHDYSESSINLATAGTGNPVASNSTSTSITPMIVGAPIGGAFGANPNGLAVQITSVQPMASSLYVVTGNISGRNLASAGIYQNGMLVQSLSVSGGHGLGGSIGGLISSLIPGSSHSVSFSGRFNPLMGFATVRAYDTNGMMAEQPIMAGGYGMNPYGANTYMRNPYTGMTYGGVGTTGIGIGPGAPRTFGTPPW